EVAVANVLRAEGAPAFIANACGQDRGTTDNTLVIGHSCPPRFVAALQHSASRSPQEDTGLTRSLDERITRVQHLMVFFPKNGIDDSDLNRNGTFRVLQICSCKVTDRQGLCNCLHIFGLYLCPKADIHFFIWLRRAAREMDSAQ